MLGLSARSSLCMLWTVQWCISCHVVPAIPFPVIPGRETDSWPVRHALNIICMRACGGRRRIERIVGPAAHECKFMENIRLRVDSILMRVTLWWFLLWKWFGSPLWKLRRVHVSKLSSTIPNAVWEFESLLTRIDNSPGTGSSYYCWVLKTWYAGLRESTTCLRRGDEIYGKESKVPVFSHLPVSAFSAPAPCIWISCTGMNPLDNAPILFTGQSYGFLSGNWASHFLREIFHQSITTVELLSSIISDFAAQFPHYCYPDGEGRKG